LIVFFCFVFVLQGLPVVWNNLLRESGLTEEEVKQSPGQVLRVLKFQSISLANPNPPPPPRAKPKKGAFEVTGQWKNHVPNIIESSPVHPVPLPPPHAPYTFNYLVSLCDEGDPRSGLYGALR
jgi:hypothetical protein